MTKYDCKFKLKAINFYKNNDVSLKPIKSILLNSKLPW